MGSFKVIFSGLLVIAPEEEARLLAGLQKKFSLTPEKAESLLQRVPIVVKKGISKEEAERYVKAFEEIGGRAKAEEEGMPRLEITRDYEPKARPEPEPGPTPKPAFAYRPESERKPFTEGMVTCPQCGFEQPESDECIKCGIIISKYKHLEEMARSVEGQVREISKDEYTPWESGEGFIGAFFQTVRDSLFSPTKFFRKVGAGTGYWISLIYGLICGAIAGYTNFLWVWLFFSVFFQLLPPQFSYALSFFSSVVIIILLVSLPIFEAITIFIVSVIIHLCLMIVGGNKKGFQATFRTFAYANTARLFYVIPFFVIPFLAPILYFALNIYYLVLVVIGVREGHEISTGRAVLGVLLPLIVFVGLIILAAIFFPLLLGSMGFFGGVRT